mgnify:CR=1 FL=1
MKVLTLLLFVTFLASCTANVEENNTIEDYLDGNMSDKESKGFEKAMKKNAQLAKEVAIVKEVNQTISQEAKLKAFKKQLSHLSDSYFQLEEDKHAPNGVVTINSPKRNNRRRWLVAATILILAISSVFIWNLLNNPADSTALFAANYEPYGLGQRSSGTNNNALEQQAIEAYNNNSFAEAIPLLEQLIDANPSNEKNILRLGSAYLSNNQSQKAIDVFQKIINRAKLKFENIFN